MYIGSAGPGPGGKTTICIDLRKKHLKEYDFVGFRFAWKGGRAQRFSATLNDFERQYNDFIDCHKKLKRINVFLTV